MHCFLNIKKIFNSNPETRPVDGWVNEIRLYKSEQTTKVHPDSSAKAEPYFEMVIRTFKESGTPAEIKLNRIHIQNVEYLKNFLNEYKNFTPTDSTGYLAYSKKQENK